MEIWKQKRVLRDVRLVVSRPEQSVVQIIITTDAAVAALVIETSLLVGARQEEAANGGFVVVQRILTAENKLLERNGMIK
jgi:hypothetical protein